MLQPARNHGTPAGFSPEITEVETDLQVSWTSNWGHSLQTLGFAMVLSLPRFPTIEWPLLKCNLTVLRIYSIQSLSDPSDPKCIVPGWPSRNVFGNFTVCYTRNERELCQKEVNKMAT